MVGEGGGALGLSSVVGLGLKEWEGEGVEEAEWEGEVEGEGEGSSEASTVARGENEGEGVVVGPPSSRLYRAPLSPSREEAANTRVPSEVRAGEARMGPSPPENTHTCSPLLALKARTRPSSPPVYRKQVQVGQSGLAGSPAARAAGALPPPPLAPEEKAALL